eukprot:760704-Hanusia_phi.AAC.6
MQMPSSDRAAIMHRRAREAVLQEVKMMEGISSQHIVRCFEIEKINFSKVTGGLQVDKKGNFKIADLGIALKVGNTVQGRVRHAKGGTIMCMAPEGARKGARIDSWGKRPFAHQLLLEKSVKNKITELGLTLDEEAKEKLEDSEAFLLGTMGSAETLRSDHRTTVPGPTRWQRRGNNLGVSLAASAGHCTAGLPAPGESSGRAAAPSRSQAGPAGTPQLLPDATVRHGPVGPGPRRGSDSEPGTARWRRGRCDRIGPSDERNLILRPVT